MAKMNVRISREYVEDQAPAPPPATDYTNLILGLIAVSATVAVLIVMAVTMR